MRKLSANNFLILLVSFVIISGSILIVSNPLKVSKETVSDVVSSETPTPSSETREVVLDDIKTGSEVKSPLKISGRISNSWMFEGSFKVKLLDAQRQLITQGTAHEVTPGSWTNPGMVEFTADLNFQTTAKNAYLVFENDNPSGLPQNSKVYEIPVLINSNPDNSQGKFCGGFAAIKCPQGYTCKLDGSYPDAGGVCTR